MKKIITLIGCIAAMILLMVGCAEVKNDVSITNDKINAVLEVKIEKAYLDDFIKSGNLDTMDVIYIKTLVEAMQVVEEDGVSYYRYKSTSSEKFSDYLADVNVRDSVTSYVDKNTYYSASTSNLESSITEESGMMIDWSKYDISKVKAVQTITFQNPVVNTNGVIDQTNPKKVTFNLSEIKGNTVKAFATTDKNVTMDSVEKMIKASNTLGKPSIKKLKANKVKKKAKKATVTVTLSKVKTAQVYWVRYATNKKFKKSLYKKSTKTKIKLTKLKKNKTYWVKAYAEKTNFADVEVDSKYSKVKKVKTKK